MATRLGRAKLWIGHDALCPGNVCGIVVGLCLVKPAAALWRNAALGMRFARAGSSDIFRRFNTENCASADLQKMFVLAHFTSSLWQLQTWLASKDHLVIIRHGHHLSYDCICHCIHPVKGCHLHSCLQCACDAPCSAVTARSLQR